MSGALLVAGTSSDAGKSILVAGICRHLARQGRKVAPFKAANMALNSMVTADGGEIGRAQAMQAAAAGVPAEAAMNPILVKPSGQRYSHVVVLGRPYGALSAKAYQQRKGELLGVATAALAELRSRFDVVVCEGAGSPAEVNLRAADIANMGLARAANLPVIVVGDIDRGGLLAHFAGTLAVLDAQDQAQVTGFVVNKFRGDHRLLQPGLDWLAQTTGRPCLGVLPWREGLWLDVEDSLDLDHRGAPLQPPVGSDVLRVAVVRLPRLSNVTDFDPLASEAGVAVDLVTEPAQLQGADLVILPGTRATVHDLAWLRERGFPAALAQLRASGRAILGICGGYQMLGETIDDPVESRSGRVAGLGLLSVRTSFHPEKVLRLRTTDWDGQQVSGYEIHHGVVDPPEAAEAFPGGCRVGHIFGTTWHGLFEADGFRRAFLAEVATANGRHWLAGAKPFAEVREARLDALADLVAENLDTWALEELIATGPPSNLPTLDLVRR
ncbi:MAG: cobyric acid synthase [Mycobacteriales bacterium]